MRAIIPRFCEIKLFSGGQGGEGDISQVLPEITFFKYYDDKRFLH